jgi:DNA replication protein DnaC
MTSCLPDEIGTGKTHIASSLGIEATRRRFRVAFMRAANLVRSLFEARDERTLGRLHNRYQKVDLLIIDELGQRVRSTALVVSCRSICSPTATNDVQR